MMTIPLWVLLAFAVWTVLVLLSGIGVHRWSRILSRIAELADFPTGVAEGTPAYCRATRAHATCVENLPIYAALALTGAVAALDTPRLDQLAVTILIARVGQGQVHMILPETNIAVGIRFSVLPCSSLPVYGWLSSSPPRHSAPAL